MLGQKVYHVIERFDVDVKALKLQSNSLLTIKCDGNQYGLDEI